MIKETHDPAKKTPPTTEELLNRTENASRGSIAGMLNPNRRRGVEYCRHATGESDPNHEVHSYTISNILREADAEADTDSE